MLSWEREKGISLGLKSGYWIHRVESVKAKDFFHGKGPKLIVMDKRYSSAQQVYSKGLFSKILLKRQYYPILTKTVPDNQTRFSVFS